MQILIDQAAKPAGVAGKAREDLALGVSVRLEAVGGVGVSEYAWSIVDAPPNETVTAASGSVLSDPSGIVTHLTPDNRGTYLIGLQVNQGSGLGANPEDRTRLTFYAGPALSPLADHFPRRSISAYETTEHNVDDAVEPTGNTDGWAREQFRWDRAIERAMSVLPAPPPADQPWGTVRSIARVTVTDDPSWQEVARWALDVLVATDDTIRAFGFDLRVDDDLTGTVGEVVGAGTLYRDDAGADVVTNTDDATTSAVNVDWALDLVEAATTVEVRVLFDGADVVLQVLGVITGARDVSGLLWLNLSLSGA